MRFFCFVVFLLGCSFTGAQKLQRVRNFGTNPRHLKMYYHLPQNISAGKIPLVVVLHGCTQNARQCARLTDWNKLADENGFAVIYPQQPIRNNPFRCFNWFSENNLNRGRGEPLSVSEMIDYAVNNFSVDTSKIFVTGLSAGAAMTTNMLAMYPDVFKAGAVFSGGAYRTATNFWLSLPAQQGWIIRGHESLGNKVRAAYPEFKGDYPRVAVFHGRSDLVVNRRNAREIIKQWTNVHHTDADVDSTIVRFKGNKRVTLYLYQDAAGSNAVVYFSFKRMGHALPTNPGKCPCQGGGRGIFSRDVNFFSAYYAAAFFGVIKKSCEEVPFLSKRCK